MGASTESRSGVGAADTQAERDASYHRLENSCWYKERNGPFLGCVHAGAGCFSYKISLVLSAINSRATRVLVNFMIASLNDRKFMQVCLLSHTGNVSQYAIFRMNWLKPGNERSSAPAYDLAIYYNLEALFKKNTTIVVFYTIRFNLPFK